MISEDDARQLLAEGHSPAANAARYEAVRCERGWAFYLRRDSGPVEFGARAWVLTDDGRARMLGLEESLEEAVGRETADGGRTGPGEPSR